MKTRIPNDVNIQLDAEKDYYDLALLPPETSGYVIVVDNSEFTGNLGKFWIKDGQGFIPANFKEDSQLKKDLMKVQMAFDTGKTELKQELNKLEAQYIESPSYLVRKYQSDFNIEFEQNTLGNFRAGNTELQLRCIEARKALKEADELEQVAQRIREKYGKSGKQGFVPPVD